MYIVTGKTRSAGDVFGIMGITNPTQKASIVAKYYALTKGLKGLADAVDDFWNKVSTSTLPLYTSGRNRLLSVRGQDKQKVVTDLWNKYISSKENIRVNITSAIIFK